MKNWFPLMLRKAYSRQYKFSYEWQRLEMTNNLRKIDYFLSIKIHSFKATLFHEVMKILGSFYLVVLPFQILMVPDVHHHCISIADGRKKKDKHTRPLQARSRSWLQLVHIFLDSGPY